MWLTRALVIWLVLSTVHFATSTTPKSTCDSKVAENPQKDNVLLQVGQLQSTKHIVKDLGNFAIPQGMLKERRPGRAPSGMLKEKKPTGSQNKKKKTKAKGSKRKGKKDKKKKKRRKDRKRRKKNKKKDGEEEGGVDEAEEDDTLEETKDSKGRKANKKKDGEEEGEADAAGEDDTLEETDEIQAIIRHLKEVEGSFFAMMSARSLGTNLSQFNKLLYFANAQLFTCLAELEAAQDAEALLQEDIPAGMLKERRPGGRKGKKKDRKRGRTGKKKDAKTKAAAESDVKKLNQTKRKLFKEMMMKLKRSESRPFKDAKQPYNEARMELVQAIDKIGGAKPSLFLGFADHAWGLVQEAAGHLMKAENLLGGHAADTVGQPPEEGSFESIFENIDKDGNPEDDEPAGEDSPPTSSTEEE